MDLQSDSDESDVDFVPDKNCSDGDDSVSEDIDETENDGVNEDVKKGKKRKQNKRNSAAKKVKTENEGKSNGIENTKVEEKDSKKHEDDLWASFLNDPVESETSKEKLQGESSNSSNVSNTLSEDKPDELNEDTEAKKPSNTDVSISNPGTLNNTGDYYISDKSRNVPISKLPARSARGGLSSVLNKIGKNNKQSTLEKSKNDWNSFKRNEGIEEEISIHNRGREGYLERQDFLQRTDLRRFEIEKNLRATKRSNR